MFSIKCLTVKSPIVDKQCLNPPGACMRLTRIHKLN